MRHPLRSRTFERRKVTTAQTDHGLAGRVALVTGAGRGIGRAIALALASEAAHVALLARSQAELDAVAREIRALGGQALVLPADVGDRTATEPAVKRARDDLGQVDVLINNAAVVWPLEATAGVAAIWAMGSTRDDCQIRRKAVAGSVVRLRSRGGELARRVKGMTGRSCVQHAGVRRLTAASQRAAVNPNAGSGCRAPGAPPVC
jgi:NAD(P)-dependent dehydrogenase (short-subunit alcohol dehydrogenase family)